MRFCHPSGRIRSPPVLRLNSNQRDSVCFVRVPLHRPRSHSRHTDLRSCREDLRALEAFADLFVGSSASYSRSGLPVQNSTSLVPRCAPYPLITHQTTTTIHRLTLRSRNPPDVSFYSTLVSHKSLATPPPTTRKTCKSTPALTVPPSRSHDNTVHTPHRRTRPPPLPHRALTNTTRPHRVTAIYSRSRLPIFPWSISTATTRKSAS
jgi:hypothetical protein